MAGNFQLLVNGQKQASVYQALHEPGAFNRRLESCKKRAYHAALIDLSKELGQPEPNFGINASKEARTYAARFKQAHMDKIRGRVRYTDIIKMLNTQQTVPVYRAYKPSVGIATEYVTSPVKGSSLMFGSTATFQIPSQGHFVTDCSIRIRIAGFSAVHENDRVRYCARPGHRLLEKVTLAVDGNEISSYTTQDMNNYLDLEVPPGKKASYLRCIGQEIAEEGYLTPDPLNDNHREKRYFCEGPQTHKRTQEAIELVVPLLFWFNKLDQALPFCALRKSNTQIRVKLANISDLIYFVNYGADGAFEEPYIESMELISGHITVPETMKEVYSQNSGMQLINLHQEQSIIIGPGEGEQSISLDAKHALEHVVVTARPLENLTRGDTWYRNEAITVRTREAPVANVVGGAVSAQYVPAIWYQGQPSIDELAFTIDGTEIYKSMSGRFYRDYLTQHYNLKNSSQHGDLYLIPFSRNPCDETPSGTVNMGSAKEVFLRVRPSDAVADKEVRITLSYRSLALVHVRSGSMVLYSL